MNALFSIVYSLWEQNRKREAYFRERAFLSSIPVAVCDNVYCCAQRWRTLNMFSECLHIVNVLQ